MGRKGPNEVRGGPNRVSAQRRRRLCRALRDALCGVLREGTRGCAGVCRGVECVGTGRVAGRLRGGVLRREGYRDGGRTGRSGGRGGGTKGCAGGGCGELRMASCAVAAGLLRDCCGRLAGCGGSWVQAGAAVAGTCCGSGCFGEGMLRGEECVGIAGFVAVWGGGWMWRS